MIDIAAIRELYTALAISVHHLSPGTSKWNKIEHRLLSFISMNWRAKPLLSHQVIVDLIGSTTTETGLTVRCELDTKAYPKVIAQIETWPRSTSYATHFTATGIIRSYRVITQVRRLIPDKV